MHHRLFLLLLLVLFATATASHAQLEIEKARYGRKDKTMDVKDTIRAYVRNNVLSFPVTPQSMGGDRNPGHTDRLEIKYKVNGKRYEDEVKEGDIFTFRGVQGVAPVRPFLGVIAPASPSVAPVRIVNQTPAILLVYALDRYGRWLWMGELAGSRVFTGTGAVGQRWRVTNRANDDVESFTVRSGGSFITIGQVPVPTRVRFENTYADVLFVYKLDRWRNWEWVARLDPGASLGVNGVLGETWIVIDRSGRTVRQFEVGPSTCNQRFGP